VSEEEEKEGRIEYFTKKFEREKGELNGRGSGYSQLNGGIIHSHHVVGIN
jgi:hypothetical protein